MAKIRTGTISVDGLDDLARALKKMDGGLYAELRQVNKDVATDVVKGAVSRAHSLGGVAAHVAPSLKATSAARAAAVSGGGAAHPAFGGAEFGGQGRPTTQQFAPHRGGDGYFLYPEIREQAPGIEARYRKGLETLIRKADLD